MPSSAPTCEARSSTGMRSRVARGATPRRCRPIRSSSRASRSRSPPLPTARRAAPRRAARRSPTGCTSRAGSSRREEKPQEGRRAAGSSSPTARASAPSSPPRPRRAARPASSLPPPSCATGRRSQSGCASWPAPLRGVVHLGGVAVASGDLSAATLSAGAREACEGALRLAQELARAALPGSPRLRVVTRGAQGVTGREVLEPLQATLWGLGRSCALEAPEIWGGLIDLDPALDAKVSAAALARALQIASSEERVALRGSERHVERIARCEVSAATSAPLALRADATYLVTGGLGGIGLELAERLAARGARRLVLLGRRAPDEKTRTRLASLEAKGCRVAAEACDVADEAALARVLQKIGADAPLRGVFHSAGVVDDVALERQGWEQFEKVLASKLHGGANLHRLTRPRARPLRPLLVGRGADRLGRTGELRGGQRVARRARAARRAQAARLSVLWGRGPRSARARRGDPRRCARPRLRRDGDRARARRARMGDGAAPAGRRDRPGRVAALPRTAPDRFAREPLLRTRGGRGAGRDAGRPRRRRERRRAAARRARAPARRPPPPAAPPRRGGGRWSARRATPSTRSSAFPDGDELAHDGRAAPPRRQAPRLTVSARGLRPSDRAAGGAHREGALRRTPRAASARPRRRPASRRGAAAPRSPARRGRREPPPRPGSTLSAALAGPGAAPERGE